MAGVQGRDFQVGDHAQMQRDDLKRRAQDYREGKRVPTPEDISLSRMKIRDGLYPYWEEQLAHAVLDAARSRGMIKN